MSSTSTAFLHQLDSLREVVTRYYNEETKVLAESVIPFDSLNAEVNALEPPAELRKDFFLLQLIKWFKNDFFQWRDRPQCQMCVTSETVFQGIVGANVEEQEGLASRVELYKCSTCCECFRYPRYNCPRKLLQTRYGRCGEWANCFTLICIAAGFDARYVYDVTDHVWTEVWSEAQNRWLHSDACEAEVDKPLMYEIGWGKKLSYVIAFGQYETADVTWRYVTNFQQTMTLRNKVSEKMLIEYQERESARFQTCLDETMKYKLKQRRVLELALFLLPPKPGDKDSFQGRTSGSLDWRLSRNETKRADMKITNSSLDASYLELTYTSSRDIYTLREDGNLVKTCAGWANMLKETVNIQRKVESDWKMAYLARTPGTDYGMFQYVFKLTKPCKSLELAFSRQTFENGVCRLTAIVDDEKRICVPGTELNLSIDRGRKITIICELSGGQGSCSWQHAQAFRQNLNDDSPSLRVVLRF